MACTRTRLTWYLSPRRARTIRSTHGCPADHRRHRPRCHRRRCCRMHRLQKNKPANMISRRTHFGGSNSSHWCCVSTTTSIGTVALVVVAMSCIIILLYIMTAPLRRATVIVALADRGLAPREISERMPPSHSLRSTS